MSTEDLADSYYEQAIKLEESGDYKAALASLLAALDVEPRHMMALVEIGELYLLYSSELEIDEKLAYTRALSSFDQVLHMEPKHAEAWSGKALALLYLKNAKDALMAAEQGLLVLPLRVGYGMTHPSFYQNVAEALLDRKIDALLELGKKNEAKATFLEAIEQYPESGYLNRYLPKFCSISISESDVNE